MPGQLLRVVVVGSVGHGKSALVRQLRDAVTASSAGAQSLLLTDNPGGAHNIRDAVTGASTADVAVVVVDAREGVGPGAKEQLAVAALFGVSKIVLAVNKMDLVGYDEAVFDAAVTEFAAACVLLDVAGFSPIPTVASAGDNIADVSAQMPWFSGAALLRLLERLPPDERRTFPARLAVQLVIRPQTEEFPDYRGYSGRLAAGSLGVGSTVQILPSGQCSSVLAIDTPDGELAEARPGRSITVRLAHDLDVARGDTIVGVGQPAPRVTRELTATVCWLDSSPLVAGARYRLRHTTRDVLAVVEAIESRLHLESFSPVAAERLETNDIGVARIRLAEPLVVDPYLLSRATGSFVLVDAVSGATVAAGLVR